jgi:23S rRNA pseudouridine1911/1915/1917 synthase
VDHAVDQTADLISTDVEDPEDTAHETREATVTAAQHGTRLDHCVVGMAPEFSRSHLQALIEAGHVKVDGQLRQVASRKLRVGQRLWLELVPTAQSQAFRPEAMDLAIVFEDEHIIVVNKPVGMVVHPAAAHWSGTLLNGLLAHHAGAAALPRAGIVHRLDKDTSGLMVVAKNLTAMTALVRAIAAREVKRVYLALAMGAVPWSEMSIEAPVGRDPGSRLRMAVVPSGKPARTDVTRLGVVDSVTALRCKLHTGRTHQIRVHLSHKGFPLVGDMLYGGKAQLGMQRQALHATELAFVHPASGEEMRFTAPMPADMAAAWPLADWPND